MQKQIQNGKSVVKSLLTVFLLTALLGSTGFSQHRITYHFVDKDTTFKPQSLSLKNTFTDAGACSTYINRLPQLLFSRGYATSSVDSVFRSPDLITIYLFLGNIYRGFKLNTDSIPNEIRSILGARKTSPEAIISFQDFRKKQQAVIDYYVSTGYPFASVKLKNVQINDSIFSGSLDISKGLLYHIDSIHQYGKLKINKSFLYRYLSILPGSTYQENKIITVQKKLQDLDYIKIIQKPDITMLGTGAVLNLYLDPKRSSQFDVLVGLVPASDANSKAHLTGDINLNLKNALRSGESILLNWQQLQKGSPRINIGFAQPYFLNSSFEIDFNFNLYKKDSAYVKLYGELGVAYQIANDQSLKTFVTLQRSYLLQGGFDSNQVRNSRRLPQNIDFSSTSFGLDYKFINTDYKFNPRKGVELDLNGSAGLKKINANNDIVNLKDPASPSFNYKSLYDSLGNNNYQFTIRFSGSKYFPAGKKGVVKLAGNAGWVASDHLFRNELFMIGGYRLLRGFDEQSIYANKFLVFTSEYRYLTAQNSYLYLFNDIGTTQTKFQNINNNNQFISLGLGVSFETKAGLLNVTYAIGKRNDVPFSLAQASKIHFGFINFF